MESEPKPVRNFVVINKSSNRITAEISYNESAQIAVITLLDRVSNLYVDVNPNKRVAVGMNEIAVGDVGEDKDVSGSAETD